MNTVLVLIVALSMQLGLNDPAAEHAGLYGQDGEHRHGNVPCHCMEEKTKDPQAPVENSNNRDRNVGHSPFESCRRKAGRTPGCRCNCENQRQEGAEVKTGPYGLKP